MGVLGVTFQDIWSALGWGSLPYTIPYQTYMRLVKVLQAQELKKPSQRHRWRQKVQQMQEFSVIKTQINQLSNLQCTPAHEDFLAPGRFGFTAICNTTFNTFKPKINLNIQLQDHLSS